VGATIADLLVADQALILELGERRVDRARARSPETFRALLDLLHDLVAIERAFREQQQGRRPDIATTGPWPTREPAGRTEEGSEPSAPEPRPVPAATPSRHRQRRTRRQDAQPCARPAGAEAGPLKSARVHGSKSNKIYRNSSGLVSRIARGRRRPLFRLSLPAAAGAQGGRARVGLRP